MSTYLVTGGAGFVGSHIAEALVRRGERVRVLDNLSTGRVENLASFRSEIDFLAGDINDAPLVKDAVDGVDVIFHEAALASVPMSVERPLETNLACVTGTLQLLDAARRAGVRRLIYAASSSLYGDQPSLAKRETDPPDPLSPYAVAKLGGEYYCRAFYQTYGFETVCLRYFNVFGPRQDPDSPYSAVIPLFISAMLEGGRPRIFGDGKQSRDFTFVENVVHGNLLAAESPAAAGRSFNLADGGSTDLLTLIEMLNDLLGLNVEPEFLPPRPGDVKHSMADITSARSVLGFEPQVTFAEGLKRSIAYYREMFAAS